MSNAAFFVETQLTNMKNSLNLRTLAKISLLLVIFLALAGCGKPATGTQDLKPFTETRTLMGTVVSITVYTSDLEQAQAATSAAYDHMAKLEKVLSGYISGSDVSRINSLAGLPASVSLPTFFVVRRALQVSKLTGGAFDITVGPLLSLWRESAKRGQLPTEVDLEDALSRVGYGKVEVAESSNTRTVIIPAGTSIDLGGIAKGYIVDQGVGILRRHVSSALVNAGGDIYALGAKPGGKPWVIGVQDPRRPEDLSAFIETLYVTDRAVATSGNYARYFEVEGKRYSHIVDPRTGQPVDKVPSATVVAPDGTTADALATAASVLEPEDSIKLAQSLPAVEALLFVKSGEKWLRYTSRGIDALTNRPEER